MKYEIIESNQSVVIKKICEDGSVWYVPSDPANGDYKAYLAWVAKGNEAPTSK
jgi:hypothetical protein